MDFIGRLQRLTGGGVLIDQMPPPLGSLHFNGKCILRVEAPDRRACRNAYEKQYEKSNDGDPHGCAHRDGECAFAGGIQRGWTGGVWIVSFSAFSQCAREKKHGHDESHSADGEEEPPFFRDDACLPSHRLRHGMVVPHGEQSDHFGFSSRFRPGCSFFSGCACVCCGVVPRLIMSPRPGETSLGRSPLNERTYATISHT